jgi:hypothetical protein
MSGLSVLTFNVIFAHRNSCSTLIYSQERTKFYISAKKSRFLAKSTSEVTIRYPHSHWTHTDAFAFAYLIAKIQLISSDVLKLIPDKLQTYGLKFRVIKTDTMLSFETSLNV